MAPEGDTFSHLDQGSGGHKGCSPGLVGYACAAEAYRTCHRNLRRRQAAGLASPRDMDYSGVVGVVPSVAGRVADHRATHPTLAEAGGHTRVRGRPDRQIRASSQVVAEGCTR